MNTATVPPPLSPARSRSRLWLVLGAVIALPFVVVVVLVAALLSHLGLGREARALRNELFDRSAARWDRQVELNAGAITLGLVRAGLSFAHLDPDARTALRAARGASVGVYQLRPGAGTPDRRAMLGAADAGMTARGWNRLVGVLQSDELVAVYAPREPDSARDVSVCVVVLHERELVLVRARADLEPLLELAGRRCSGLAGWRLP